jgi:hypothetical protein
MSWAQRVGDRAYVLSSDASQADAISDAFRYVAREWADADASAGAPFSSGITSEGFPVELSLKQSSAADSVDLRFIAQPGHVDVSPLKDRLFQKIRAIEFASAYAGVNAASYVAAAMDFLPVDDTAGNGNFFLWLGLELRRTKPPIVKIYLNPTACSAADRGLPFADSMVAMAGFGSVLPAMTLLATMKVAAAPHIIGINLDADGVRSVKVYFPLPGT